MSKLSKHIGSRIKYFRQAANLSQLALANLLDTEPTTIAHYESGRNLVSLTRLQKMAEVLKVELYMFFISGGTDISQVEEISTLLKCANAEQLQLIYKLIKATLNSP